MTGDLGALLAEPEALGKANDATETARPRRLLNITRDTGRFLAVLVRATDAKWVLEIGTSNGYSTLRLAAAARAIGGSIAPIGKTQFKVGLAEANLARSGLERFITLIDDPTVDGNTVLYRLLWRRPTITSARCSAEG